MSDHSNTSQFDHLPTHSKARICLAAVARSGLDLGGLLELNDSPDAQTNGQRERRGSSGGIYPYTFITPGGKRKRLQTPTKHGDVINGHIPCEVRLCLKYPSSLV